jgi:response regulator RpfG family c-di-GMP phosphodiesterase
MGRMPRHFVFVPNPGPRHSEPRRSLLTWGVITNVRMPEMSAIELQARLRDRGSSLPFILITAVSE